MSWRRRKELYERKQARKGRVKMGIFNGDVFAVVGSVGGKYRLVSGIAIMRKKKNCIGMYGGSKAMRA